MALYNLKICLFVAMTFATLSLRAQNILVGFGSGGGTFEMNSTKEFNQTIIKLLPFKPSLKNDFPPYFFYKAEVLYCFPKILAVGFNISTTSTGARLTLADYSGKYTLDNVQKGIFPGIKILLGRAPGTSNGINFSMEGGAAYSTMTTNEEIKIFEEISNDKNEYKANGYFVQPGICYFRSIGPRLKICVDFGYYYGFEKGYHVPDQKDQKLFNSETKKLIKPQWDGIRLGLTAYWGI